MANPGYLHFSLIIAFTVLCGHASGNPDSTGSTGYMVLIPAGINFHQYPVLKPLDTNDPRYFVCKEAFEKTFLNQMIRIHKMVQQYLLTIGKISRTEPAYLLLSGRIGGFPMNGFYLKHGGTLVDKRTTGYVDLKDIEKNYSQPGSFTQIFPHELAHIYYRQLTGFNPDSTPSYSSDIHYYSIVTDYYKAFNEGFAESFENISRNFETDRPTRQGIDAGFLWMSKVLPRKINGYDRDFRWPFRAGFYRMTMLFWYQQLEDYKRFAWSRDNLAGLIPVQLHSANSEKAIAYRNSCVLPDQVNHRNIAQSAATEGVICTFFTRMMSTGMIDQQVMKELVVITKYLSGINPSESPFHVFIRGYIIEYPREKEEILKIYQEVTTHPFVNIAPPELWILNRQYKHSSLVMAPFGGADQPFYTFNLNTAGIEDLMTFGEISRDDALTILHYRDSHGLFTSLDDLQAIPDLSDATKKILLDNRLVPSVLKSLEDGGDLKISNIIYALVWHFFVVSLLILAFCSGLIWFIFYYRGRSITKVIFMILRSYGKLLLFMVAALSSIVFVREPLWFFIPFLILIVMVNIFRTRHSRYRRLELLSSTMIIGLLMIYFLI